MAMKRTVSAGAFGAWGLLLILTGAAALFSTSLIAKAAFFFCLFLPGCSALTARAVRKHLRADFSLPVSAVKSQTAGGESVQSAFGAVNLHNGGFLSCGRVDVTFSIKNELTGEASEHTVTLSAPSRGGSAASFLFSPNYCGMLTFSIKNAVLYDWFGLLRIPAALTAQGSVTVLPATFDASVMVDLPYSEQGDEENINPLRGTEDPSVIYALREYQAGDPVRRMHWKLSAKRDLPIVKEISRPVSRSLVLFWNKTAGLPAGVTDALAEVFASVAMSLTKQGIPFTAGWRDSGGEQFSDISGEEELFAVIARSVRRGAGEPDAAALSEAGFSEIINLCQNAKTVWFAGEYPFAEEPFLSGDSTVFLCGKEPPASGVRFTLTFAPEEAEQVFRAVRI